MLAQVLNQFGDARARLDDPAADRPGLGRGERAARPRAASWSPRPQRRRPVGLRWSARWPSPAAGVDEPERRHAGHRGRRHRRQPRRVATRRTGPAQVGAASSRRSKALFNEELGVVLQVPTDVRDEVMQTLQARTACRNTATSSARPTSAAWSRVARHQGRCSARPWRSAAGLGRGELAHRRAARQPRLRRCRARGRRRGRRSGPAPAPDVRPGRGRGRAFMPPRRGPKVAILREQGVNSTSR